ncbi:uncharacterized protein BCN122_II0558 [Burkholderia cenocepacia]|nr:uncharacterized protein BCN122_II0558 [Burkholderia cenocepacia]
MSGQPERRPGARCNGMPRPARAAMIACRATARHARMHYLE